MGMSTDMAPKIVALAPTAGEITYILNTADPSQNVGQLQLALPVSEVLLIEDVKSLNLTENPFVIADIQSNGINCENIVVLISQQPQEVVILDSSVPDADTARQWYGDSATATNALSALSQFLTNILTQSSGNDGDDDENCRTEDDDNSDISESDDQKAEIWVQDSALSAAALFSLKNYLQQSSSKS